MKKITTSTLALFLLLNTAGVALAVSADSFADVPAKHWAYDAISKLTKDGVLEGDNGHFMGDKTITRYEMAIIVAKAIAKEDKASTENKALIDKLAAEFTAELNNLGVRVNKVEAKTHLWFMSETRIRYTGDSPSLPAGATLPQAKLSGTNSFDWRERLHINGDVNSHTTFTARLVAQGQFGETGSTNNASGTVDTNNTTKFDRLFFTTNNFLGLDQTIYGRQKVQFGQGFMSYRTANNDGVTVVKKIDNVTVQGGILDAKDDFVSSSPGSTWNASEFSYVNLLFPLNKDVDLNLAYYNSNIPATTAYTAAAGVPTGNAGYNSSKGWVFGTAISLGKWTLDGEYVTTTLEQTNGKLPAGIHPTAFAFQLTNATMGPKVFYPLQGFLVDCKKPGQDAWSIMYHETQAGAIPSGFGSWTGSANGWNGTRSGAASFGAIPTDNTKGWYIVYENVVDTNIVLSVEYQDIKFKDTGANLDKTIVTSLQFLF